MDSINEKVCPDSGQQVETEGNDSPKAKIKIDRKIIYIASAILLICIIGIVIKVGFFGSPKDKAIKVAVKEIQDHLYDPSSVEVYDCKLLDNTDEDDKYIYVYFDLGAKNKAGKMIDDEYMVKIVGGKVDSYANLDIAETNGLSNENAAAAQLIWGKYAGMDSWERIDADKVEKVFK